MLSSVEDPKSFDDELDDGDDDELAQLLDDLSHNVEVSSVKVSEGKSTEENHANIETAETVASADTATAQLPDADSNTIETNQATTTATVVTTASGEDANHEEGDADSDIDMDELALLEGLGDADLIGSNTDRSIEESLNGVKKNTDGDASYIASEVDRYVQDQLDESNTNRDGVTSKDESGKGRPRSIQQGILDTTVKAEKVVPKDIVAAKPEAISKDDFERIRVNYEKKVKKCEAEIRAIKDKLAGYHADFLEQCENYGQPLRREGPEVSAGASANGTQSVATVPKEKPAIRYTDPTRNNLSFNKNSRRSAMSREEEERAAKERAEVQAEIKSKKVEVEKYSGISITQRRFTAEWFQRQLDGKHVKRIAALKTYFRGTQHATDDFVVIGVLESLVATKDGTKEFWSLTDLNGESQSFLLKKEVANDLKAEEYKRGSLVAILNPTVMKKSADFKSQLVVVNEKDQVINMGDCPDLAICKGKKKDGKKCTMAVNKSKSAYCKFHLTSGLKEQSAKRPLTNAQQSHTRVVNVNTANKTMKSVTRGAPQQSGAEKLSAVAQASDNANLSYIKPRQTKSVAASKGIDLNSNAVNGLRGASQYQKIGMVRNTATFDPSRARADKKAETASRKLQKGGFMQCPVSEKSSRDFLVETERKKRLAAKTALIKSKIRNIDPNQCPPVDEDLLAANLKRMDEKEAAARKSNKRTKDSTDEGKPRKKILRRGTERESKADEKPKFGELARGRLNELVKKEAINQKLHQLELKELEDEKDEMLIRKEQIYDVMASTKENTRTCQYCEDCDKYFYSKEALCVQKGHTFKIKKDCVVRYFKCNGCKKKVQTINMKIPNRCKHCKCTSLTRMGMIDEKTVKPGSEFLARGEEHGIVLGSKPMPAGANTNDQLQSVHE